MTIQNLILSFLLSAFTTTAFGLELPTNLNESDRIQISQILGNNTATKYLTNPYPLGGYSGFEIGWSLNSVATDQIALLGNQAEATDTFQYSQITFGKGLYSNVDIFTHFALPFRQNNIFEFGGFIKWSFYEADFIPLNVSLAFNANSINIDDRYIASNLGTDLMAGLNLDYFSIYFGLGKTSSDNLFSGTNGTTNLTDSGKEERFSFGQNHSFIGMTFQVLDFFIALQADKFRQTSLSAKLGLRF